MKLVDAGERHFSAVGRHTAGLSDAPELFAMPVSESHRRRWRGTVVADDSASLVRIFDPRSAAPRQEAQSDENQHPHSNPLSAIPVEAITAPQGLEMGVGG